MQPKPQPKHTHPHRTTVPGVTGCKRSMHTAQHPSQEWRGAAETRAQTHTPTPRTRARIGSVQAEHAHSPTIRPGVAGRSRNPSTNTHTHTAHPCQEWLGASRAHTQPNTPARSGGAQPRPEPKHTHPHRAPVPGVAGCKRSAHTSTHTAQHPSQEWRGAAKTRAQTHIPTPRTRARSGWVQAEHTQCPTPQPGVAGRSRNPTPNTHTHTAHPCQEWLGASGARTQPNTPARSGRGAAKARAQTHTPTPRIRARNGWVQAEHTHSPTPQPGVAGRSRNSSSNRHTHTAHPCQESLGASGARTQPITQARSAGAQPKPEPKHTHPHRARMPGVAGCKRSTHTAQHPSQEWRGAAETRAQTHTPTPRTRARSGWVQAEHTHSPTPQPGVAGRSRNPSPNTHTHTAHPCQEWLAASGARTRAHTQPNTPARRGGAQPKRELKHTHPHGAPVPGVAGCKRSARTSTHTPQHPSQEGRTQPKPEPKHTHPRCTPQPGVAGCKGSAHKSRHKPPHPSQEWRGAAGTQTQPHTPTPHTPARSGRVQAERTHKRTHTPTPQPGVAGRSRNPNPTTTQTQTQAPRNSRKPSVHSPGTEAARAMQVIRPNEIWRPGVRLHPEACAALGLVPHPSTSEPPV